MLIYPFYNAHPKKKQQKNEENSKQKTDESNLFRGK